MYTSHNNHNLLWDNTKILFQVIHQLDILKTLNSWDILKMPPLDILLCHINNTLQVIQMGHILHIQFLNISHCQLTIHILLNNNNFLIHPSHIKLNSTLNLDILMQPNLLKVMVRLQFSRIKPLRLRKNMMKKKEHLISLRYDFDDKMCVFCCCKYQINEFKIQKSLCFIPVGERGGGRGGYLESISKLIDLAK